MTMFEAIRDSLNNRKPEIIDNSESDIKNGRMITARDLKKDVDSYFPELKVIISTSETMLPFQKIRLQDFFSKPIIEEYGCSETDIISFQCELGGNHIISENVFIEIEKIADEPEGFGQVLVTDLNNKIMLKIRLPAGWMVFACGDILAVNPFVFALRDPRQRLDQTVYIFD